MAPEWAGWPQFSTTFENAALDWLSGRTSTYSQDGHRRGSQLGTLRPRALVFTSPSHGESVFALSSLPEFRFGLYAFWVWTILVGKQPVWDFPGLSTFRGQTTDMGLFRPIHSMGSAPCSPMADRPDHRGLARPCRPPCPGRPRLPARARPRRLRRSRGCLFQGRGSLNRPQIRPYFGSLPLPSPPPPHDFGIRGSSASGCVHSGLRLWSEMAETSWSLRDPLKMGL